MADMLRKAEAVETEVGFFYEWLSGAIEPAPTVRRLLSRLSLDGRANSSLLAYQRRALARDCTAQDEGGTLTELCEELDELARSLAEFRESTPRPTVVEAVEVALRVETAAVRRLPRELAAAHCPGLDTLARQREGDHTRRARILDELTKEHARRTPATALAPVLRTFERRHGGGRYVLRGEPIRRHGHSRQAAAAGW